MRDNQIISSVRAAELCAGEAYQFDWSHDVVLINGTTVTVKVAHVRLYQSRMLFVRTYTREPFIQPKLLPPAQISTMRKRDGKPLVEL